MLEWVTALLAAGVAGGYFAIAALIVPRIRLENATPRFVTAFRIGGLAFFIGCGLTHTHIAYHALSDDARAEWHEVVFHLMQVVGVWVFVYAAVRFVDVRIVRRPTAREREAEELERRVEELSRSNSDLEEFAHVVAHDLQEPLRTMSGFAELLERRSADQLGEDGRESVGHIVSASRRMAALLDGVLAYSRVAAVELDREPVELGSVVMAAVADLRATIDERGAAVTWDDDLPTVQGDRVQLERLMLNLISNAVKFGAVDGPHVHVSATRQGISWAIDVADDGPGIAPEDRERIFRMFERAAGAARGTGVGLAVSHKIVERHGGTISVHGRPGGGSVFRFTLPDRLTVPALPGTEVPVGGAAP